MRQFIATGTIFSGLQEEAIDKIVDMGRTVEIEAGRTVFRKGDPGEQVLFIVNGSVKVECGGSRRLTVNVLRGGEVLGEMALLGRRRRSATVTTLEPSEFLVVDRDDFIPLLEVHPRLAYQLILSLSERLRRLTDLVESVKPIL
ncbi:MAG: cyclic nucleotide-binding domain-containing protein [Myxococcota bacterium]